MPGCRTPSPCRACGVGHPVSTIVRLKNRDMDTGNFCRGCCGSATNAYTNAEFSGVSTVFSGISGLFYSLSWDPSLSESLQRLSEGSSRCEAAEADEVWPPFQQACMEQRSEIGYDNSNRKDPKTTALMESVL